MPQVRSITELSGLRVSVETNVAPKGPMQCKRCQGFGHTQRNCGYAPRGFACWGFHLSGGCSNPREQPQCCDCGGNNTANKSGYVKWKEAKATLQSKRPSVSERAPPEAIPPFRKPSGPGPLASRWTWARGGITLF